MNSNHVLKLIRVSQSVVKEDKVVEKQEPWKNAEASEVDSTLVAFVPKLFQLTR